MNNILDFGRLFNLLRMDIKRTFMTSFNTIVVLVCVYVFLTLFSLLVNSPLVQTERLPFYLLISVIYMIMLPRTVYGKVNDRREGVEYGMLPVSTTEKFISMVLTLGVIAPVAFYALIFVLDAILVFLSPEASGSVGYLWNATAVDLKSTLRSFASISLLQTAFIFGNLYFKSRKVTKTLLAFIGIHLVLIFVLVILGMNYVVPELFYAEEELVMSDEFVEVTSVLTRIFDVLYTFGFPSLLLLLSFLKLKNLQYK